MIIHALLNHIGIGVIAGDQAERRPWILIDLRVKMFIHPLKEFGQPRAVFFKDRVLCSGALFIPVGERDEFVSGASENLALDRHDVIRMHGQIGMGEAIRKFGQFAAGVDEPSGAIGLQLGELILQGNGHARLGEVRMQRAIEIGGDELKRRGHGCPCAPQ